MGNNIDIFICGHKPFDEIVKHKSYTNIFGGYKGNFEIKNGLTDNTRDNISDLNGFYSELTSIYWVWKNLKLKDYVGFCHYRRYFDFLDNIPEIIDDKTIILPHLKRNLFSMRKDYAICHNVEDFDLMVDILKEKKYFEEDYLDWISNKKSDIFICNMFVMPRKHFEDYCELFFSVMNEFLQRRGFKTMEEIVSFVQDNKDKYLKECSPNDDVAYQSRIGGFLSERLFNFWVYKQKLEANLYSIKEIK